MRIEASKNKVHIVENNKIVVLAKQLNLLPHPRDAEIILISNTPSLSNRAECYELDWTKLTNIAAQNQQQAVIEVAKYFEPKENNLTIGNVQTNVTVKYDNTEIANIYNTIDTLLELIENIPPEPLLKVRIETLSTKLHKALQQHQATVNSTVSALETKTHKNMTDRFKEVNDNIRELRRNSDKQMNKINEKVDRMGYASILVLVVVIVGITVVAIIN